MGLGYPTLNRYDPRSVPGLFDSTGYYSLVTEVIWPATSHTASLFRTWPSPFIAGQRSSAYLESCFLRAFGRQLFFYRNHRVLAGRHRQRIVGDYAVALISGFLYLADFAVANFNLSGYVDSAVNCMMIAVAWTLLTERWWLLPLWGVSGGSGQGDLCSPLVRLCGRMVADGLRRGTLRLSRLAWVGAMVAVGFVTLILLMSRAHTRITPLSFAASRWDESGGGYLYLSGLVRCLMAREFFFVFGWLLPLGVWRLGRLPKTWVVSSACAALAALAMGAYDDAMGNVVRPVFSAIGPLLSLSASILLLEIGAGARRPDSPSASKAN